MISEEKFQDGLNCVQIFVMERLTWLLKYSVYITSIDEANLRWKYHSKGKLKLEQKMNTIFNSQILLKAMYITVDRTVPGSKGSKWSDTLPDLGSKLVEKGPISHRKTLGKYKNTCPIFGHSGWD